MTIEVNTDNNSAIIEVVTNDTQSTVDVNTDSSPVNDVETYPIYGPKGDKGDKGDKGNKGDKGDKGDTGAQGPQGEQGIQGIQGEQGPQGEQGIQGETGNGIASIDKTSTSGLVDTYTITYTNGDSDTFTVTNGESPTTYIYEQAIASDTWVIEHNLNKMPSITLIDQFGKEFDAEKEYPTGYETTKVIIHLNGATTGKALLN